MSPSARQDQRSPLRTARLALCVLLAALAALPAAAQAAPPANDDFADAQVVSVGDRVTGTTLDATAEAGEPAPRPECTSSVWYRFTPSIAETLRINNCGGDLYAELNIFTGTGLSDLTEVPRAATYCRTGDRLTVDVVAGTTYYLRVAGYTPYPGGEIALNLAHPQIPANDDFANAQPVVRLAQVEGTLVDGTLVDATEQPGEPDYGNSSSRSVWYKLVATANDVATVSTYDPSTYPPSVAVYTGNAVGSLTKVSQAVDPAAGNKASVFTKAGTTYYIAVRSHGDESDDFTLILSAPSPPSPPGDLTPPPAPTCPIQSATGLPTYSGTHSGGGTICLSLSRDFSRIESFHANNVPGDRCTIPWTVFPMLPRALPLLDRRFGFANASATITGAFPTNRGARGTLQVSQAIAGQPLCTSASLTWTATTRVTPPWADLTAPSLRLGGATVQRPLRRGRALVVRVRCRGEACAASASVTVAGVRVTAAKRTVRPSTAGRTMRLALSARARRALAAALRTRRSVKARVTVVARDSEGNRATARRTITLRR